jgi:antitoxin MazE
MKARVSKWGNSLAIRLPKAAVASLQVHEGARVDLVIEGETLVAAMRPENQPEILDVEPFPSCWDRELSR